MVSFGEKVLKELVHEKVIEEDKIAFVRESINQSDVSIESVLVDKLHINRDTILNAKSVVADVPGYKIDENTEIDREVLSSVPAVAASQYQMIPLLQKDNSIIVGMVDPTNIKAREALNFIFLRNSLSVDVVVLTEEDFYRALASYQGIKKEVGFALQDLEDSMEKEVIESNDTSGSSPESDDIEANLKAAPITKIVAVILKHAIEGRASDIHIEILRNQSRVRFRLDGELHTSLVLPHTVHNAVIARIKILASLRLDESRIPQDGRFSTQVRDKSIDFRVSTFPTSGGEKAVLRVLDSKSSLLDFKTLGIYDYHYKILEEAVYSPYGMILASGPTGSGKTTSLYTALSMINKEGVNLVSLEDPVEYHLEGMSQSQIRPDIGYTFASGLRSILRQDPDVIMVGEIRDAETAQLAVQAALTGHLVFSTIHTNNAVEVIPRLIDLGVDTFLLPGSFSVAIAQRLVGRLCEHCKVQQNATGNVLRLIEKTISSIPSDVLRTQGIQKPYTLCEAKGCARCNQKKIKGRVGIYEMIKMTDELKAIVLDDPNEIAIEKEAEHQQMITMKQDGIMKALQGTVSVDDVLRVTEE
ncbi:MAG: hypothetical protein F4X82_01370 [Candidatus Spechtbacteria bacterium SB0662_bin_43]|uniref:Bacterial type II secretion system protein E domain-containing protein n=1 Tax=Candidatus Spechtbacteria bacterium SB0662_bin_43 TaxID=2604897 RepID=A0A845D9U0_9BACT|nr:hypothetical protein [Candidatus Spechtbacteria bacterium SB0662_bin_43]